MSNARDRRHASTPWDRVPRLMLFVLACACSSSDGSSNQDRVGGPLLTVLDSVVLQEPDSLPGGRFANLTTSADGHHYISDLATGRVLRFDRDGRFDRVYSRLGGLPASFRRPDSPASSTMARYWWFLIQGLARLPRSMSQRARSIDAITCLFTTLAAAVDARESSHLRQPVLPVDRCEMELDRWNELADRRTASGVGGGRSNSHSIRQDRAGLDR